MKEYKAFKISQKVSIISSKSQANLISSIYSIITSKFQKEILLKGNLIVMELTHFYDTPTIYAFHESCCWKLVTSSYFASLPMPNPSMLLMSSLSGICRTQKWTAWNPASSKQSFISGKDHLGRLSTSHSLVYLILFLMNSSNEVFY